MVWLNELVKRDWIVLTKDERIRCRPLEIRALRESGLRVFIAVGGNVTGGEAARIILKAIPRILRLLQKRCSGALLGYIYKDGTIRLD